jgi:hypothetical protein
MVTNQPVTASLRGYETPARLVVTGDIATEEGCRALAAALSDAADRHPGLVVDLTGVGALNDAAARILAKHRDGVRVVLVACQSPASRMLRAHPARLPVAYQPRPHRQRRRRGPVLTGLGECSRAVSGGTHRARRSRQQPASVPAA